MITLIFTSIAIGLIVYLFLKWASRNHDVFEKQGLKFIKPLPLLGNCEYIFKGRGIMDRVLNTYNMFPNEKVIGLFEFTTPIYFLRSPELVKQLTIKDFTHFPDHKSIIDSSSDEFFASILFSMKGEEWRQMRASLSPIFTGSKMRTMLQFIEKCSKQFVEYIRNDYVKNGPQSYRLKDIFSRYTNDVIATCAFGVECDSLKYQNNEIYKFGQEILQFQKPSQAIKFLFIRFVPSLARLLGIRLINDGIKKSFNDLIINTMEVRKKEGIVRPDMLQLLMKLKEGQQLYEADEGETDNNYTNGPVKRSWTDTELIAQCFLFFLAGFDTSSNVMTFIAYELALNPEVQTKLIETIDETYESLGEGGLLKYETLQKMKYMDMVISEAMRKWPALVATDRECVNTYNYVGDDGMKFTIEKGDMLMIPIYGFHMDPKYFPNPEKFDPERFSDANKANIDMNTYLPFGVGPRNCIGNRFALMEIKVLFFFLLLNFRLKVCGETQVPLKLKRSIFAILPEKDIQLQMEPRRDKKVI